ncbi:MAG: ABC transporter permease [Eggerthellaceae bacterium]
MSNLLRLIGRRLIALPIMIIGVTILVFFLMALSPIDQAYSVLGENASEAQVQQYREEHGLNDPVLVQYGNFMVGLVQGDLGTYGANSASVADRIASALPVTLQLTFMGLIIAVVLAVILGVISALYRDRWPDQVIRIFSIAFIATPSFWLALLILLFSSSCSFACFGPLPSFTSDNGWMARMAMPAFALAVPVIGQLTRVIRTSMVEELDKDYVRGSGGIPKGIVVAQRLAQRVTPTPFWVFVADTDRRRRRYRGHSTSLHGMAIISDQSNYTMLVQGVVLCVAFRSSSSTSSWICSIS